METTPNSPLTIVIFGATGDLYADKLARALYDLFLEGKLPTDFKIIAFGRRDFDDNSFRTLSEEKISKKGSVNSLKLNKFLRHIEYFKGDFLNKNDFLKLNDFLSSQKQRKIIFHVATSATLYKDIFENIKYSGLHLINKQTKILIEKPFGENESDTKFLHELLSSIFSEENIFHIDHYLAKETVGHIFDFRFQDGSLERIWNNEHINKIRIVFHESNVVGSRGASYDRVGAFRDMGENHMVELLAILLMEKPRKFDAKSIREARTKVLSDLYIDYDHKMIKGQYQGYQAERGVTDHSTTETFFRIFLKSRNRAFSNIPFELECGKGLVDMHSEITSTTVFAEVNFKDGSNKTFKIQPVPGTKYNSYGKVYTDVMSGDQTLFVSMDEIIVEWKLADELLSKWKDIPLIIYKKGTRAEDIK